MVRERQYRLSYQWELKDGNMCCHQKEEPRMMRSLGQRDTLAVTDYTGIPAPISYQHGLMRV